MAYIQMVVWYKSVNQVAIWIPNYHGTGIWKANHLITKQIPVIWKPSYYAFQILSAMGIH